MSKIVFNTEEVILDNLNILWMNTKKDNDKMFVVMLEAKDQTRIGDILVDVLKEEGNLFQLVNSQGTVILENHGVVSIRVEFAYEVKSDTFEERLYIESLESFI